MQVYLYGLGILTAKFWAFRRTNTSKPSASWGFAPKGPDRLIMGSAHGGVPLGALPRWPRPIIGWCSALAMSPNPCPSLEKFL